MAEQLSQSILEHIGDGVLSVDKNRVIVFSNRMACKILRIKHGMLVGRDIDDVMHLEEHDGTPDPVDVNPFHFALTNGEQKTYDRPMRVKSIQNELVYVKDTISPIRNSDGDILGAVMVFRDVTAEVHTAFQLDVANQRYQTLFDSIKSGVAVFSTKDGVNFSISDFNAAAEEIEGVVKKNIIGKRIQDIFPGATPMGIIEVVKKVWLTGQAERMPCVLYTDSVKQSWRDNYIYKLPTGEVVSVYDDVTDKKTTAARLSDNIGKLRDNEMRLRGMFERSSVGVVIVGE